MDAWTLEPQNIFTSKLLNLRTTFPSQFHHLDIILQFNRTFSHSRLRIVDEQEGLRAVVEACAKTHAFVICKGVLYGGEARFKVCHQGFNHKMIGVEAVEFGEAVNLMTI